MFSVRPLAPGDAETCDAILRSLPDFFGHEGGLTSAFGAIRQQVGAVVETDGKVVGFATWEERTAETAEITWAAVHVERRGGGAGTVLIETLCEDLASRGYKLALAMTSAASKDASIPDTYIPTRAFWNARGFHPLIELDIWDTNFALLMVRPLQAVTA
jgi:GNAT superfamily N-acetyltransferase